MSRKDGGGCLTAVAVVLSVAVLALGVGLLYLVMTGGAPGTAGEEEQQEAEALVARDFQDYDWDEVAQIADLIAAADTDEAAAEVAADYNVSVGQSRSLTLTDGTVARVTVVGLRHDERADGTGVAGLTLMASPISSQPMNAEATNAGGWEASTLRAWLASDGMALVPDELSSLIVPVTKLTNNAGVTSDASAVTQTTDSLWLFSAVEVCGPVTWFVDEFGDEPNVWTGYVDYSVYDSLISSEGSQYEYFSAQGVTGGSDPNGVLSLAYGTSLVPWWYRTPYPYTYTGEDESFFYQVMSSGFPSSVGIASDAAGVTVGFCL